MHNKIINAGIRITRKCSMRCIYCNIPTIKKKELSLNEWKEALRIVKKLGVKDIVLLGGEPTVYEHIVKLVRYITQDLELNCSLTTNAFNNYEILVKLLDAKLTKLGFSIDNLNFEKSISKAKSMYGLNMLKKLLKEGNKNTKFINYTVINRQNCDSIEELIKYMSSLGVSTYILPFHWGDEGNFEHRKNNEKFAFIEDEDVKTYCETINRIIDLKKFGYLIENTIEFLEISKEHIKDLNWKCNGLSELRIDSDGKIVCCCDKVGEVNKYFTIFDLKDETKLEEMYKIRELDANKCNGCLWPSSVENQLRRDKISQ